MKRKTVSIGDILANPGVARDFIAANPDLVAKIHGSPSAATGPSSAREPVSAHGQPKGPKRPKKRSLSEQMMAAKLERQLKLDEILSYQEQPLSLTIGTNTCKYTPDFLVRTGACAKPLLIECKGKHKWEDAVVKFKAAKLIWGWLFNFEMWEYTQDLGFRQIYE